MKLRAALRNPELWPWIIITAGIIIRLWDLTSSPIWYDESFTTMIVRLPLTKMVFATANDFHPPLYYFLVWLWLRLAGESLLNLRMLSVAFSIYALIEFKALLRLMALPIRAQLIALALFAFHPMILFYAQEGRNYSLLLWLVIAQAACVVDRDYKSLAVYTAAGLYTHNYMLFYSAALGLVALLNELTRPREMYRAGIDGELTGTQIPTLIGGMTLAGVLYLPWVGVLLKQMQQVVNNYWIEPLSPGNFLYALFTALGSMAVPSQLIPLTIFSVFAGLVIIAIRGLVNRQMLALVWAFGSLACVLIVSLLWHNVTLFRGMIGVIPPLCILAGITISEAWTVRGKLVSAALVAPLVAALCWQVGANHVGRVKESIDFHLPRSGFTVHIDDTTLIRSEDPAQNVMLDAGCPPMPGGLTNEARELLGFRTITMADLPKHFQFVGVLGPLSTGCHERVYHQLTAHAQPVTAYKFTLGEYGVWNAVR